MADITEGFYVTSLIGSGVNQVTGDWQEEVIMPAYRLFPVPDGVSDEDAAGYFVNPATAWLMRAARC